jgi:hypothetical protein
MDREWPDRKRLLSSFKILASPIKAIKQFWKRGLDMVTNLNLASL